MMIHPTQGGGALLTVSGEELRAWGLVPEALDLEGALDLAQAGAARAGLALERPLELEAYPAPGGMLLFVRPLGPRRQWTAAPLEALLAAARALGPRCAQAELVWQGGQWRLGAPAGEGPPPGPAAAPPEAEEGALRLPGPALALLLGRRGEDL